MTYTISFLQGDQVKWSQNLEDEELTAGMLFAGWGILDDLNAEEKIRYTLTSNLDINKFIRQSDVTEDEVRNNMCQLLPSDNYGVWLKGTRRFVYNLYGFSTSHFLQGIISMAHAFNVDFRNYILGLPFDEKGKQYTLKDYVFLPNLIAQDAPDLNDVEEEEKDDENTIEPLARTDDIIELS